MSMHTRSRRIPQASSIKTTDLVQKKIVEIPEELDENIFEEDDNAISDDSDIESDGEDSHANVMKRMRIIQERKQELIKRLKLHEATSKLRSSLHTSSTKKTPASTKKKNSASKLKCQFLPRRKSLRLQNIEASAILKQEALQQAEEVEEPRPTSDEYPVRPCDLNGEDEKDDDENNSINGKNVLLESLSGTFEIKADPKMISKSPELSSYVNALKEMNVKGCVCRKLVEKRIYAIAMHPRNDFLLVAAASTGGTIGLWKVDEVMVDENQKELGSLCNFSTYARSVSHLIFPQPKPYKLFFSSYAGVVRSLDLDKSVFDQAVFDSESLSASTFDFQDPLTCNVLLIGSDDGGVTVRDVRARSTVATFDAHNRIVKSISVHPLQNQYFSSSSNDRLVKIYDFRILTKNMKAIHQISDHFQTVDSAYFSPVTGNQLLTTSLDNRIRVYDTYVPYSPTLKSCISHNNLTGRWLSNFRAVWHPSLEDVVAVGSMERPVRQIDLFNSKLERLQTIADEMNLTSVCSLLALHPSRHVIAGGNSSGKVFLFEN